MEATPAQIRRALVRAERGATLDVSEAAALLAARDESLDRLCAVAARVRDAGLIGAGRPGVVTYSPKVFIPITRLCRDRCHYCTFVTVPRQAGRAVPLAGRDPRDRARGRGAGVSGGAVHPGRPARGPLARGPGVVGRAGLRLDAGLRPGDGDPGARGDRAAAAPQPRRDVVGGDDAPQAGVAVDGDDARDHVAPAVRDPRRGALRLPGQGPGDPSRVLEDAGRLSIPFTTGLLVGIGETLVERAETIFELRRIARLYGSIQEVIVQNFRAKPDTAMRHADDLGLDGVPRRHRGGPDRARADDADPGPAQPGRQPAECRSLLDAGVDDWGGVSPLTPDHVNPERPWPSIERLRAVTAEAASSSRRG